MELSQLANLGEFVSGVAVLVTLVYLAIQVRQSNTLVRLEAGREMAKDYTAFSFQIMNAEIMKLLRTGLSDFEALSRNDQARLHNWLTPLFVAGQSIHLHAKKDVFDEGMATAAEQFNANLIRSPGLAIWLEKARDHSVSREYRDHLEEVAASQRDHADLSQALPWYGLDPQDDSR